MEYRLYGTAARSLTIKDRFNEDFLLAERPYGIKGLETRTRAQFDRLLHATSLLGV